MRTVALVLVLAACKPAGPPIELYADGLDPRHVRFEVEDLGAPGTPALREMSKRGDIDGTLLLPEGACPGSCRAALVSVFVENKVETGADKTPLAPPVVRLDVPPGKPARQAFSFRGEEITAGRIGRIRWIVEMWPEERALTATVSSSVFLDVTTPPKESP